VMMLLVMPTPSSETLNVARLKFHWYAHFWNESKNSKCELNW